MRINKLFSNYGICSRKETNKLIEEERIKVNGKLCVLGQWVDEDNDEVLFDNMPLLRKEKIYIAFNKPSGIICTTKTEVKGNITDFMKYPKYIFPVGRLDKESQGLIIMTNDGVLANEILEAENMHEKEYIVEVDRNFDEKFLIQMAEGVEISTNESYGVKRISDSAAIFKELEEKDDTINSSIVKLKDLKRNNINKRNKVKTRPCKIYRINDNTFRIILTQGLNRQIRKMSGALGYKVIRLERIRIMNIKLNDIGRWRNIHKDEIKDLMEMVCVH